MCRSNVASAWSVSRSQSLSVESSDTGEGPRLRCSPWSIADTAYVDGIASLSTCMFLKPCAICVEMAVISVAYKTGSTLDGSTGGDVTTE